MPARSLTDEQDARAVEMYESGRSAVAVAEAFGLRTSDPIYRALRRRGIKPRRGGPPRLTLDNDLVCRIRDMYENKRLSQVEIGNEIGFSQSVIHRAMRQAGIPTRPRLQNREGHGNWKGGRTTMRPSGYIAVTPDPDLDASLLPMRNRMGYILEHRLVMARHLGRALAQEETVHHINGDPADNRIENLQLRHGKHGKHVAYRCRDCGSMNVAPAELTGGEPIRPEDN